MYETLQKVTDKLMTVILFMSCFYLLYVVFACSMQVFSRYVLNSSFAWTEETARYAFISMGMLGVPIALRRGLHVKIDLLENMLSEKGKLIQRIVIDVLIAFTSVILCIEGVNLVIATLGYSSVAVELPFVAFYYTIPTCGFLSFWVSVMDLLAVFAAKNNKEGRQVV